MTVGKMGIVYQLVYAETNAGHGVPDKLHIAQNKRKSL